MSKALRILVDGEFACEIRGLPSGRSIVRSGEDIDGLCRAAASLSTDSGIYYAVNPIRHGATSARKETVVKRRWFLIDIDPVKYEKDASATNEEKASSSHVRDAVLEHLSSLGWPGPVMIDSGNGYHLLYRIEMPNDDSVRETLKSVLYSLAGKFNGPEATIDRAVHDAPRIAKLPGTWAKKGTSTQDRPFRKCRLVNVPDPLLPVGNEYFANPCWRKNHKPRPERFLKWDQHKDDVAYSIMDKTIDALRAAKSGNRNNALNLAAFKLGRYIAAGIFNRQDIEYALFDEACHLGLDSDGGCREAGIKATIASGINAGMGDPATVELCPTCCRTVRNRFCNHCHMKELGVRR